MSAPLLPVLALAGVLGTAAPVSAVQSDTSAITYEAFLELPHWQRQARFRALTPEQQSALVRTHGRRWLDENRASLSAGQVKAVEGVIDVYSPEAFNAPETRPASRKREMEAIQRMRCAAGLRSFDVAFVSLLRPLPDPAKDRTWWSLLEDGMEWVVECAT